MFSFCEKLEDTIDFYSLVTDRYFLIEVLGDIVTDENKLDSNKIRIVKEISREEIEEHIQDKTSLNAKRFLALYTTNIDLLETLTKDEDWAVRRVVASNPNTPTHILEKLFKDKNKSVCRAVARNVNTPEYILEELSKDKDWDIRRIIASNKNTPAHILEELVKDKVWRVRFAVAENPNINVNIFKKLAKDENETVSKKAEARLKEITQ